MSGRIAGIPVIFVEPDGKCELCGKIAETRPYGPSGERVCFECGMKDEKAVERGINKYIYGEDSA
jgi:hypothetical protein